MFESAKLKLQRADQHIGQLNREFLELLKAQPHRPVVHGDRQSDGTWQISVSIETQDIDPAFSTILGDAIHNLRCALDHAVWELIGIDGGTQDRTTKLPAGADRQSYEASCRGMKTPREDTKDFLARLAVYPDGNGRLLYALNKLDNRDKHSVLVPVLAASSVHGLVAIDLTTNARHKLGTLVTSPGTKSGERVLTLSPGYGLDANHQIYATPEIFFGDVELIPYQPMTETLWRIAGEVHVAVTRFAAFVSERE